MKHDPENKDAASNAPTQTTPFTLMSAQEFFQQHGGAISSEAKSEYYKTTDGPALVYSGDAHIAGTLHLQTCTSAELGATPPANANVGAPMDVAASTKHSAIIVIGDLTVHGNLVDVIGPSTFLCVTGALRAKNMLCGDSIIHIDGDAYIEGVTLGYNNDGITQIGGTLRTAWYEHEDHPFYYKKLEATHPQTFVQLHKAGLFRKLIDNFDDLRDAIANGDSPLAGTAPNTTETAPAADYQYWLDIVTKRGRKIKNVPPRFLDEKLITAAIQNESPADVYPLIPKARITQSLLRTVARSTRPDPAYFPNNLWTQEIVDLVKTHNNWQLSGIPSPFRTRETCLEAARHGACHFADIPVEHLDEILILEVIRANVYEIKQLHHRYINTRALAEAAKQGHFFLSENMRFEAYFDLLGIEPDDVALAVVDDSLEAFDKLPGVFVTEAVYNAAESKYNIGSTAAAWEKCKNRHSSSNNALDEDGDTIAFTRSVWRVQWTQEYFESSVKKIYRDGAQASYIRFVPPELFTEQTAWHIIKCASNNMSDLPPRILTPEICFFGVIQSAHNLKYVPDELFDENMALAGVDTLRTPHGMSDGSGDYLESVPVEYRTKRVCQAALENARSARKHIPPYVLAHLE